MTVSALLGVTYLYDNRFLVCAEEVKLAGKLQGHQIYAIHSVLVISFTEGQIDKKGEEYVAQLKKVKSLAMCGKCGVDLDDWFLLLHDEGYFGVCYESEGTEGG
jgi:hypothetical protein